MTSSDICNYTIAFLMTLVLEVAVAILGGYRRRVEIACVVLVNVFSWPLLVYLIWVVGLLQSSSVTTPEILLFEAGVVVIEWMLLCYALPRHPRPSLFLLSLTMNGVSYFAGWLMPWA